ncbi:Ni(II)/Co(II)-binding transcriptional repressor RcnR [Vibrio profundum]|uniref:Ni(II)/Co(II)-binding transcriptional repressor RcnR n=1 Tax=Vibrio profundum TaxID=2910247 RepID=UPI003D0B7DEE
MSHTSRDQKKLKTRVSKIQGQLNGLQKMLDQEHQCTEVLQQIAAVRGAVNGLMREVIKGHLVEHVVEEESLEKREQDFEVVLNVLNSYIK